MARDLEDDAYIAELLKQDAKKATKKYELVGIDAFNPRRMNSRAPRPNKGFLQHLIRQTDSHNAALLAKETAESRARLRNMDRKQVWARKDYSKDAINMGRLGYEPNDDNAGDATPSGQRDRLRNVDRKQVWARKDYSKDTINSGRSAYESNDDNAGDATPSGGQRDRSEDESKHRRRRGEREGDNSKIASSRRHRDRSRDWHRHKRRHDSEDEDHSRRKRRRSKSPRDRSRKDKYSKEQERYKPRRRDDKDGRHERRRSHSRTASRSRSPHSSRHEKHSRHQDRTRSRSPKRKHALSKPHKSSRHPTQRSPSPASSSDPLEAIVGPLPPPREPTLRSKGRGAYKANNQGIELRFSSTYDPKVDVRAPSDVEDDWGDALEALRDRARWQQQGADRLKAAGFTDAQVKKWEKGEERDEEDVVWTKRGQAREWDRGKVLDDEGDVDVRADFGRLK